MDRQIPICQTDKSARFYILFGEARYARSLALPLGELSAQPTEREKNDHTNVSFPLSNRDVDRNFRCVCTQIDITIQKASARPSQSPSVTALPEGEPRGMPATVPYGHNSVRNGAYLHRYAPRTILRTPRQCRAAFFSRIFSLCARLRRPAQTGCCRGRHRSRPSA